MQLISGIVRVLLAIRR